MAGNKVLNADLEIYGKMSLTNVPNSTGTVVTYNPTTKNLSHRTNTEIISDLGLITATNIAAAYYTKVQLQTSGQSQVHWGNITSKPTTVAGYGITNAMTTAHAANAITTTNITNWNTAFGWGNHASAGYVTLTTAQNISGLKNFTNGFDINTHQFRSIDTSNILIAGGKNVFGSGTNNILDSAIVMGNNIFPSMNLQTPDPQVPSYNKGYLGIGTDIFINYTGGTNYRPEHNAHDSWIGYGRALGAGFLDGTNVTMIGTTNMHRNDVKYADCVTIIGKGFSNGIRTRGDKTLDPNRVVIASNGNNVHGMMSDVIGIGHENWIEDISHSVVVGANLRPYSYVFNSLILGSNHVNMNYEGTQAQADMYLDNDVVIGMGVQKRTSRHAANNNLLIGMDGFYTMGSAPNPNYRPLVEGTFKNAKFQINGVIVAGHEVPDSDRPNETDIPLTVGTLPIGVTFNAVENTFTFDGSQSATDIKVGEFIVNPNASIYVEIGTRTHTAGTWGSIINGVIDSGNTVAENFTRKQSFIVSTASDFKLTTADNFAGTIYIKFKSTDLLGEGIIPNITFKDSYENITTELRGGKIENGHLSIGLNTGKFLHLGTNTTAIGKNAYSKGVISSNSVILGTDAAKNNSYSLNDVIIGYGAASNANLGSGSNVLIGVNTLKNPLQRITTTTTLGQDTLLRFQYGTNNTAVGASSGAFLLNGSNNLFAGQASGFIKNGSNNTMLGYLAGGYGLMESTLENTIVIGANAVPEVPNNTTTIATAANTDNFLYGTTHSNAFKVRGGLATQVMMANGTLKDESSFGGGGTGNYIAKTGTNNITDTSWKLLGSTNHGLFINEAGDLTLGFPGNIGSQLSFDDEGCLLISAAGPDGIMLNGGLGGVNVQSHIESSNYIKATSFIKTGGTASQFLKADGTVDSNTYLTSIPTATSAIIGGRKLFSDTVQSVTANAVSATGSRTYGVQVNASGQMVVNVPWTAYTHPNSGVTAGTYRSVTVNAQGHVTAGTNPTTLAGYGITDALPLIGGNLTGQVNSTSIISVSADGADHDPYAKISVTRGTASNFGYFGLTRAGNIAWQIGIDTSNNFVIGTSGQQSIIDNTFFKIASNGVLTTNGFVRAGGTATQVMMADGTVKEEADKRYLTTEINTGETWIDGKTIYRKYISQEIVANSVNPVGYILPNCKIISFEKCFMQVTGFDMKHSPGSDELEDGSWKFRIYNSDSILQLVPRQASTAIRTITGVIYYTK